MSEKQQKIFKDSSSSVLYLPIIQICPHEYMEHVVDNLRYIGSGLENLNQNYTMLALDSNGLNIVLKIVENHPMKSELVDLFSSIYVASNVDEFLSKISTLDVESLEELCKNVSLGMFLMNKFVQKNIGKDFGSLIRKIIGKW